MNSDSIFPLLYAAPISYYAQFIQKEGILDPFENFTKQNYRSRARVFGANGVIALSIPVDGKSAKNPMQDAQISNIEPWQRNHWKTLESAYKSSPFFEFYQHLFLPFYEKTYDSLWQFNLEFHQTILMCLEISNSTSILDHPLPIKAGDHRALYSSKNGHPLSSSFPEYQQVFSYNKPFERDLSILDGLFNLGPELESYLLKLEL